MSKRVAFRLVTCSSQSVQELIKLFPSFFCPRIIKFYDRQIKIPGTEIRLLAEKIKMAKNLITFNIFVFPIVAYPYSFYYIFYLFFPNKCGLDVRPSLTFPS